MPWVDPRGRLSDAASERLPDLLNTGYVHRYMVRNYPPVLRDAGVHGKVELRFRVLQDGSVDSTSRVMLTTHPLFTPVAIQAA